MNKINLLFLMLLLPAASGIAEVYKWVDSSGKLHYGDTPPAEGKVDKLDVRINSLKVVTFGENTLNNEVLHGGEAVSTKNKPLVMYSTTWCGYCKRAVKYFKKNNIPYQEYDIEKSVKGKRDYKRLKGKGVPIILMGKKRMNGFSVETFERMYRG